MTEVDARIQVRAGNAADHEQAVKVWQLANTARRDGVSVPAEHEDRVRGYLAKPDAFLVVAEVDEALVGMAIGMQALDEDGLGPPIPGLCHVSMVFVHPERWGRGIGKQLMLRVIDDGVRHGYDSFQLWTHADNRRAQRLYEGLGFTRTGRSKDDDLGERIVHYRRAPTTQNS